MGCRQLLLLQLQPTLNCGYCVPLIDWIWQLSVTTRGFKVGIRTILCSCEISASLLAPFTCNMVRFLCICRIEYSGQQVMCSLNKNASSPSVQDPPVCLATRRQSLVVIQINYFLLSDLFPWPKPSSYHKLLPVMDLSIPVNRTASTFYIIFG